MKKVINAIFRRLNEKRLAKQHRRLTVPVCYKGKEELRSCLLFYSADSEPQVAFDILKKGLPKVHFQQLCFAEENGRSEPDDRGDLFCSKRFGVARENFQWAID